MTSQLGHPRWKNSRARWTKAHDRHARRFSRSDLLDIAASVYDLVAPLTSFLLTRRDHWVRYSCLFWTLSTCFWAVRVGKVLACLSAVRGR